MTAQPQTTILPVGYPPKVLKVGDTTSTWCGRCMTQTEHKFEGWRLVCLSCHPEEEKPKP